MFWTLCGIRKKRAKILREEGKKQMENYLLKQIGNTALILVEKSDGNMSLGKSQHFIKIEINDKIKEGEIVKCMITKVNNNILNASLI